MISILQTLVVLVAILLIRVGLGRRQTHAGKAWKKIGLVFLALGMAIAVFLPETTSIVAHFVGVGRGADLLLYILTLAFITYALNGYLRQQDERDRLFRLARKVALLEAVERYGSGKNNQHHY